MAGLEAGLCQPQAAQPNPGLDPAAGKITHGLNFQAARFLGHAATSAGFGGIEILGMMSSAGWSGLWPRMKSAAFCAELVRAHDFARYASTLFVPAEQRRAPRCMPVLVDERAVFVDQFVE